MTLNELAQRLATMHDSNAIFVLEALRQKEVMYLVSNLRPLLNMYGASVASYRGIDMLCIERSNKAQTTCHLCNTLCLPELISHFSPGTPMFTFSRTGVYESKI